jgi:hypothetical protein
MVNTNHGQPPSNLLCTSNQPWKLVLFEHITSIIENVLARNTSESFRTVDSCDWWALKIRASKPPHARPSKPNKPDPDPFRNWSGRGVSGRAKNTHPTHKKQKTKPYRMGRMPCQEHTQKYHLAWASLKSSHWLTYVFLMETRIGFCKMIYSLTRIFQWRWIIASTHIVKGLQDYHQPLIWMMLDKDLGSPYSCVYIYIYSYVYVYIYILV